MVTSLFKGISSCFKLGMGSICFMLFALPNVAFAKQAKPLFASDDVIKLTVTAPFSTLTRNAQRSKAPYDARLTLEGVSPESHSITLAARGNSRRDPDVCRFPPLRVKFPQKPGASSLFYKQKSLKLVTHCSKAKSKQKHTFLEYATYKMFNALSPQSMKVRLAEVDYVEAKTGKVFTTRYGFFIEDADDAADRNNLKEIDRDRVNRSQLAIDSAARYGLFQYMIGNLDWSMQAGPKGSDCCHNTKLLGASKTSTTNIVPIAYDFDLTGFVDAPYAAPPVKFKLRSVKTRLYRGFCDHNDAVRRQRVTFQSKRSEFENAISTIPEMSDKDKSKAYEYLTSFYKTLDDPQKFETKIINKCRG